MTKSLAKRMRELRERTGRTQEEIADLLDIRRQTYNSYEQGNIMPKTENIIKIAKVLHTTPNYLLGWEDEQSKRDNNSLVGDVIRRLREEKQLTLVEVAAEFNIPLKTLKAYENGTKEIPQHIIEAFAKYFGTDIENIIAMELESDRKHAIVTTSETLKERYQKWQDVIGYNNHFTDSEIDEIITFAKYIQFRRKEMKGGGK